MHPVLAAQRQRYVASYVLPTGLGRGLQKRYPSVTSVGPAQRALRQWLRLHVVAPGMLALPSRAVALLWHDLIGDAEVYREYSRHAYGHLHHPPDLDAAYREAASRDGVATAATFAMACRDEGLPRYQTALPLLFGVDDELGLPDGQRWTLNCGHADCVTDAGVRCVHHELLPLIPDDLPHQLPYRPAVERTPVNLNSDDQFGSTGLAGGALSGGPF